MQILKSNADTSRDLIAEICRCAKVRVTARVTLKFSLRRLTSACRFTLSVWDLKDEADCHPVCGSHSVVSDCNVEN